MQRAGDVESSSPWYENKARFASIVFHNTVQGLRDISYLKKDLPKVEIYDKTRHDTTLLHHTMVLVRMTSQGSYPIRVHSTLGFHQNRRI